MGEDGRERREGKGAKRAYFDVASLDALHGYDDHFGFAGREGRFGGLVGFCHLGCGE